MKVLFTIFLLLGIGLSLLNAQAIKPIPYAERQSIKQTSRLSSKLDLSNEESQRLMTVFLKHNQQREALWEQTKKEQDKTHQQAQLAKIAKEEEKAIAAVLTPAQLKQWEWNKTKTKWKKYYYQGRHYWFMGLGFFLGGVIGWGGAWRRYSST